MSPTCWLLPRWIRLEADLASFGLGVGHANGYGVESYVGDRVRSSRTSNASPNVGSLAAKILAVNPKLTPPQVIEITARRLRKRLMAGAIESIRRVRIMNRCS
jgi:hypothetical protein